MELNIDAQCKGTRIITGKEARQRRTLLNLLIGHVWAQNYQEIILPTIEPLAIYTDKAGEEVQGQIYTFMDKGERTCCLRPEVTATIQLIADKHYNKRGKDIKLWYFEKCYRYERPQAGRYREFFQFGVEVINPSKDYKEELITLASELVSLVTPDFTVDKAVKRGLNYYTEDGFEISVEKLGAQKQVCGGGKYKQGIGFALGFDRLMLCLDPSLINE